MSSAGSGPEISAKHERELSVGSGLNLSAEHIAELICGN